MFTTDAIRRLQIITRWTRSRHTDLSIINFERTHITSLTSVVVRAGLAVVNASLALIFGVGVEAIGALIDARVGGRDRARVYRENVALGTLGAVSDVIALFAFVQAGQTLPVVRVVEGEETWLTLIYAEFCGLRCAIR